MSEAVAWPAEGDAIAEFIERPHRQHRPFSGLDALQMEAAVAVPKD